MFSETFEQATVIPAQIYLCSFQLAASIHPQKTRSSCSSTLRKVKKQASINSLLTDPLSKQQSRNRFFCTCAPANKQASINEPRGHLLEQRATRSFARTGGGRTNQVSGWPKWPRLAPLAGRHQPLAGRGLAVGLAGRGQAGRACLATGWPGHDHAKPIGALQRRGHWLDSGARGSQGPVWTGAADGAT